MQNRFWIDINATMFEKLRVGLEIGAVKINNDEDDDYITEFPAQSIFNPHHPSLFLSFIFDPYFSEHTHIHLLRIWIEIYCK